ncbi:retrovirus-related Pol polyprotein from transposon 297 [Nephila pilipes]|uniref:Retrovirus-related Pol polyprotein from transposon 297 n=1 Tax=Nephila pilipes TaxID=299642 RepID=A0A8X6JLZ1_NEPPI|nr:retrovirus-related Pol polyprotein from transposon 297 [Nephila pilipes]
MADGIMAVAGPTSSIHVIDTNNQNLNTMLMEISSHLSRLETRERSTSRGPAFQGTFHQVQKTMFLPDEKLQHPSLDPPSDGAVVINRLYLSDRTSQSKYLIDTGAVVSVIPLTTASKHLPPASLQIFAANGTVGIVSLRRFIPHAARTQAVLNSYLKGAKKNDRTPILWSEESAAAFEKCKKDLAEATVLYHPSADASLAIVVDASDTAVGAALHQQTSKGWQPLAFFSKTLSPAQQRYSAYDRELLAAYMAIKYFRHMVEG